MIKYFFISMLLILGGVSAEPLTLHACYEKAEANHPLQSELVNRRQIFEMNRKNLGSKWMPQFKAGAQASYMSNVVEFDKIMGSLPIPIATDAFQSMPHEQYKATIELTQTLYDGGAVRAAKLVEKTKWLADRQAAQVEFYKIRSQINSVYFALLMLQKQEEVLELTQSQAAARRKAIASAVDNGMMLPQNLYSLDAEILKLEQNLDGIAIQRKSLLHTLEQLIGEPVTKETRFELPVVDMPDSAQVERPELELFQAQKTALEASKKVIASQQRPKVMLFGTYGYGNPPGSDFFTDEFDDYYLIGAGLSWTPFDWRSSKRSKLALQAQQNIIAARQKEFERMIQIAMCSAQADIAKARSELAKDPKLISLRQRITAAAAAQLENGVISATEYLAELNAERQARINMEMHNIQIVQAQIDYLTLSGQLK